MNPYYALAAAWGAAILFLGGLVYLDSGDTVECSGSGDGGAGDCYINP